MMNRDELNEEYRRLLAKINTFMAKWSYRDRINNKLYHSYYNQIDAVARRIKELNKPINEERNRLTSQIGINKPKKVGRPAGKVART